MNRPALLSTTLILFLTGAITANADLIAENTSDADVGFGNDVPAGQSVTTGAGGPWDNLTFNWLNGAGSSNPTAFDTLFFLDQQYTGAPPA